MAKRGRKSAAERELEATNLRSVAGVGELPRHPDPPDDLTATERKRWQEIVGEWPVGRWNRSDLALLRDLVLVETAINDCRKLIKRDGYVIENSHGAVTNPAVTQLDRFLRTQLQLQRALRLPPSMRVRIEAAANNAKRNNAPGALRKPWER